MAETASEDSGALAGRAGAAASLRRRLVAFVGTFLIWVLLVGSLDPAELGVGVLVALVTALVSGPYLHILDGLRLRPALPLHVLRYLGVFLLALVRANVDMARRVVSPSLPIRPALVEVRTNLQSVLGRLLLANSITLTPGTLSVDVQDDRLLVHWIDVAPGTDTEAATRAIAADFERHLREFLQ